MIHESHGFCVRPKQEFIFPRALDANPIIPRSSGKVEGVCGQGVLCYATDEIIKILCDVQEKLINPLSSVLCVWFVNSSEGKRIARELAHTHTYTHQLDLSAKNAEQSSQSKCILHVFLLVVHFLTFGQQRFYLHLNVLVLGARVSHVCTFRCVFNRRLHFIGDV